VTIVDVHHCRAAVARTSDIDETELARFLGSFAEKPGTALAYHHPFYLRFLADTVYPDATLRFVIARDEAGEMVGLLPGIHIRTRRLDVWASLAYFGPNGGALVPGHDAPESMPIVRALVSEAQADARELGCGSMTIHTPLQADADVYRSALDGVDFDVPKAAQWLPLPADAGSSPWPRKVRYDIRRAASLGVSVRGVETERELDEVWDIYDRHGRDVGMPIKPRSHVRQLFRTAASHGVFLRAEQNGETIAGLVCFMGGGVLSYYLPCTRDDSRSLQPGLLLLDRAVALARSAGCSLLNFEASPIDGDSVFQFKARCGATTVPYHVLVKLLRPGVLEEYRELTPAGIGSEAPNAFVIPFSAIV
jgi:hypothetical protein